MNIRKIKSQDTIAGFLLLIVGLCLVLGVSAQILTGYANNGDFARSAGFVLQHAMGFQVHHVTPDDPNFEKLFFKHWLDLWQIRPEWPFFGQDFTYSSYKLYLLLQLGVSALLSNAGGVYSIILGSVLSRVLIVGFWSAQVFTLRKTQPVWLAVTAGAALALLVTERSWIAFLNSFYEEQMMVIFLPALAALMLRVASGQNGHGSVFALMLCALLLGAAKTAYFYVPTVAAIFCALMLERRTKSFLVVWALCQWLAFIPVAHGQYKKVNAYHSLYFGALTVLNQAELNDLPTLNGKPVLRECVGVAAFFAGGGDCVERAKASYRDVLLVCIRYPKVLPMMLDRVMDVSREIDVKYLGKDLMNSENAQAPRWGGVSLFQFAYQNGLHVFIGILSILACCLIVAGAQVRRHSAVRRILLVGLFLALIGWLQYLVALGDGFYELQKHAVMGGFSIALGSVYMVFGALSYFMNGARRDSACQENSSEPIDG